jgi:hypothetical protein
MRVTKIMEQYITERINQKYESDPRLIELQTQADKSQECYNNDFKEIKERYTSEINQLLQKHNYSTHFQCFTFTAGTVVDPHVKELIEFRKTQNIARKKEIQDIIFKIELGNNKDAWDKLIEEEVIL